MLEGRKVLELRLVWIISDGQQVDIWKEPWVFQNENSMITTERGDFPEN